MNNSNEIKVQVLLSTMNQKNFNLLKKMNIQTNTIIINQCNKNSEDKIIYKGNEINMFSYKERGLSISRNRALKDADSDICLIADDDLIYIDDYEKKIISEFEKNKEIDIIIFKIEGINKEWKRLPNYEKKINKLSSLKVSSVQMAFRLKKIREKNIFFNEKFGAGAEYISGEENLFLLECLKKGLKIKYVPIKIADLYIGDSSWFEGYNEKYLKTKGAFSYCAFKELWWLYVLQFALRKYKIYKKEISLLKALKVMFKGKKEYKFNN